MVTGRMPFRIAPAMLLALSLIVAGPAARAEQWVQVPTRPGIIEPVMFLPATGPPGASVLMFVGGNGVLGRLQSNFLMRVRNDLAQQGFNVALADVPSDHGSGMGTPFRSSDAQAKDVAAIIEFLKTRSPAPVWLIGTSRGSVSAANAAARLGPPAIAGVILTSSVWADGMEQVALEKIAVPVLIIHNREDGCRVAPFDGAEAALARLSKAPVKEFVAVAGGTLESRPCNALSPHGYYGIEEKAVAPMITFIKAHTPVQ